MKKIPCSVPILTLNSGKYLARCLESVRDFEDVFIVDGNSTDDTREIAKRFGVPIYKQVETDEPNVRIADFTAVRSRAYGRAKTDWLLVLDSDEYITRKLEGEIRSALGESGDRRDVAFLIEKKLVIEGKEIEYSFSREVAVRLYNTKSGIAYMSGKTVHEKLSIPSHVSCIRLHGVFYSEESASYKAGIKKDDYYLSLVKEKMFGERTRVPEQLWRMLKASVRSLAQAGSILGKSCALYLRHGYAHSLPFTHVMRYVRYHLVLSQLRIRQLWFNIF